MNQSDDSSLTFKDHLAGNGIHPLKHLFFLSYRYTCLSLNNTIHCCRKKALSFSQKPGGKAGEKYDRVRNKAEARERVYRLSRKEKKNHVTMNKEN